MLCIQTCLKDGLVPYPLCNYADRKLLASLPLEFIDYFDEVILYRCTYNAGERNKDNPLETLYNEYKEANKNSDIKQATFTKWISKISDHRKLILNPHNSGERDRIELSIRNTFIIYFMTAIRTNNPQFFKLTKTLLTSYYFFNY